jgi:aminopeptidase N
MASQRQGLRDPNTLSNYDDFKTTHTVANLSIDFSKEQLAGNVTLILEATASVKTGEITLDTSYLDVLDVKVRGSSTKWDLLSRTEPYGSALKVQAGSVKPGTSVTLDVCFRPPGESASNSLRYVHRYVYKRPKNVQHCSGLRPSKLRIRSIHICVGESIVDSHVPDSDPFL